MQESSNTSLSDEMEDIKEDIKKLCLEQSDAMVEGIKNICDLASLLIENNATDDTVNDKVAVAMLSIIKEYFKTILVLQSKFNDLSVNKSGDAFKSFKDAFEEYYRAKNKFQNINKFC